MGLQRLLWACALLIVARVVTLFAAPIQPSEGDRTDLFIWEKAQSTPPIAKRPEADSRNPVQDQVGQVPQSFPQSYDSRDRSKAGCQAAIPAVVTIHAGREIGSGSIVSSDGLIITNFHVVRRLRNRPLFVETQNGSQYDGQVIATDRPNDLALIRLATSTTLPMLSIFSKALPETGQPVCAIGSPFGQTGVLTQGNLVKILPNGDLQSNVLLKPGNSGGPLLNGQGEMIGVNKGVARNQSEMGDRISFATNAIVAQEFIQQNHSNPPMVDQYPNSAREFDSREQLDRYSR